MPWLETGINTVYEARPGQDLKTVTQENLDAGATPPTFPPNSFNREFTTVDGKGVARYSYYEGNLKDSYVIRASMSTEPIATHPMFQEGGKYVISAGEWTNYKKWQQDPTSTSWKPDSATTNFKRYYAFIEKGIEYFLNGTVEAQITEIINGQPNIKQLGRIDAPPRAPSLPNSRNWMIVGVDAERIGDTDWRQTVTYRASMDNGWNKEIYT